LRASRDANRSSVLEPIDESDDDECAKLMVCFLAALISFAKIMPLCVDVSEEEDDDDDEEDDDDDDDDEDEAKLLLVLLLN
jgi:hypothetical protein